MDGWILETEDPRPWPGALPWDGSYPTKAVAENRARVVREHYAAIHGQPTPRLHAIQEALPEEQPCER